jgi:hypothetical protein
MATPAQIRAAIDTWLANAWPVLVARQATYYANHNRYWQGIRNPATLPADGTTLPPDLSLRPGYQAETWADFGLSLPAQMQLSIEVHQYIVPDGTAGFVAFCWVTLGGRTWLRARDSGAEPWRTQAWADVTQVVG